MRGNMKNRLIAAISLIMITFVFSTGCLGKTSIKKDLTNYIKEELPTVFKLETDAINSYASVSGANYSDDQTMYKTMKETVIPTYKRFVDKLDKINPKTKQVNDAHEIYVTAAKTQLKAFNEILTALENQDVDLITQANTKLSSAKDGIMDFKDKISDLCNEYDVDTPW